MLLGADPTPLLHGDRLTIGGQDLLVVEVEQVGSTQHINVAELADLLGSPGSPSPPLPAGQLQGGRLVCLTDGREYAVGSGGVVFCRDAKSEEHTSENHSQNHSACSGVGVG